MFFGVLSSLTIVLLRKRELVALFQSCCDCVCLCPFFTVPWVGMWFVTVALLVIITRPLTGNSINDSWFACLLLHGKASCTGSTVLSLLLYRNTLCS